MVVAEINIPSSTGKCMQEKQTIDTATCYRRLLFSLLWDTKQEVQLNLFGGVFLSRARLKNFLRPPKAQKFKGFQDSF